MVLVWRSLKLTGGYASWESHFKNFFIPFYPFFFFIALFSVSFIAVSLTRVLQDCSILMAPPPILRTNRFKGYQLHKISANSKRANFLTCPSVISLLKPTCYVMHRQFNIQQLYALPTLYLCVLYLSENKQRLLPLTA